jgi:CheY-like chemotaxis protein
MDVKRVILVVEDNDTVRAAIAEELEEAGFNVQTARSGDEASHFLPKLKRIDLLLTDIRMPGRIDGWLLADMARCRIPHLPVIYASGYSPEDREVEGSLFISKPYHAGDILAAIVKLCNIEL